MSGPRIDAGTPDDVPIFLRERFLSGEASAAPYVLSASEGGLLLQTGRLKFGNVRWGRGVGDGYVFATDIF